MQRQAERKVLRPGKNRAEAKFIDRATQQGWIVMRRGWPDYLCVREKDGNIEIMAVEVKHGPFDMLRPHQRFIGQLLASKGIQCFRYDAESSVLQKIRAYTHSLVDLLGSCFDR